MSSIEVRPCSIHIYLEGFASYYDVIIKVYSLLFSRPL